MNDNDYEWISVSELARRIGKSKQTAYNWIVKDRYEKRTFNRGTMTGILVKYYNGCKNGQKG